MKSKGTASLYEVLKSASRGSGEAAQATDSVPPASAEGGALTLQERLAAYKAQKLAEAQSSAPPAPVFLEAAPSLPAPPPPPPPPDLSFPVAPYPARVSAAPLPEPMPSPGGTPGLGERIFKLTYNTAAFAMLVVVGLVFLAYAVGVKVGRSRAAESAAEAAASPAPPHPAPLPARGAEVRPPPAPPREFIIRLADWPYGKPEERLKANDAAGRLQSYLERNNYRGSKILEIRRERDNEKRLALYIDDFREPLGDSARTRLAALQKLKVQNQWPFEKASFEVRPKP